MSATSSALENSLVQAMTAIAGTKIQGYQADQTILGVVQGHVRDNLYEVSYNGGLLACYAEDGANYMPASSVYVLVPQGNFSKKKTIIGLSSSSSGEEGNLTTVSTALDGYEVMTENLLSPTSKWGDSTSLKISSYRYQNLGDFQELETLYRPAGDNWVPRVWNETTKDWDYNQYYSLDTQRARIYGSAAKGVMLKADFRTNLPAAQARSSSSGDYGLILALHFKTENAVYESMQEKWDDLVSQTSYYYYDQTLNGNTGSYTHRTLDYYKDKVYVEETSSTDASGIFVDKTTKEDIQDALTILRGELEAFIIAAESSLSEQGLGLCHNFSDWLLQLTTYDKDDDGNLVTPQKLKELYLEWFTNKLDVSAQNSEKTIRYEFGINNMLGNPLYFNDGWHSQTFIQPVDFNNFAGVAGVYFYCRDFDNTREMPENLGDSEVQTWINENWTKTIKVRDVELYFLDTIDEENSDYKLELTYPDGKIFDSYSPSEEIEVRGQLIYQKEHNYTSRCTITWFKENPNVTSFEDEGYSYWAGAGWEKLSSSQTNVPTASRIFNASENKSYENRYLCVATQSLETILKAQFVLYNAASKREISIISNSGTSFGAGGNAKMLTCLVNQKAYNFDELYADNHYRFNWRKTTNGSTTYYDKTQTELETLIGKNGGSTLASNSEVALYRTQLTNTVGVSWEENELIFPSNQISASESVEITCVVEFAEYPDAVDESLIEWVKVGEASITLTEQISGNIKGYNIEIENGSQVFQYSEGGVSPCSDRYEQPYETKTLTCAFYSPGGGLIDPSKYHVKWMWPLTSTMLIINPDLAEENSNTGEKDLYDQDTCPITISEEYNMNAVNNQITCIIEFNGGTYYKETNFYFGKVGENGSNATEVIAKISPLVGGTTNDLIAEPLTLNVYSNPNKDKTVAEVGASNAKDASVNPYIYRWNNGEENTEVCLGLQLFRNNDLINPNEYKSIKWEIAGTNNLTASRMSVEDSTIASDQYESCYVTYNHALEDEGTTRYCRNHIIKATASLDVEDASGNTAQQKYYGFYPLPIIVHEQKTDSYSLGINRNKTLRQVMYNGDGRSPQYAKGLGVTLKIGELPDANARFIQWSTGGGVVYRSVEIPSSINPKAQGYYEAADTDIGYQLTNDTAVTKGSNGRYKKYYSVNINYKEVLTVTKIEKDSSIQTVWVKEELDLDDSPVELELWEQNGTSYKLTEDTICYTYTAVNADNLSSLINPSAEGWYVKESASLWTLTTDTERKAGTTYYKYLPTYTAIASPSGNPYTSHWYELYNGTYVRTSDKSVQAGKIYYTKNDYTVISDDDIKECKPYYEHFYVQLEDGSYVRALDTVYKGHNYYYYREQEKTYYHYEGYRTIDPNAVFNVDDAEYVGVSQANCDPSELGWYQKSGSNYVLTEDTGYTAGKVYYEFAVPQIPMVNGWYQWSSNKFVASQHMTMDTGVDYYSLATTLDQEIDKIINLNPVTEHWYVFTSGDDPTYVATTHTRIDRNTVYYKPQVKATEIQTVTEMFLAVEGDRSPFLNLVDPETDEISETNLVETKYYTEKQSQQQTSELQKEEDRLLEDWAKESQSLYNTYIQYYVNKLSDGTFEDRYKDGVTRDFEVTIATTTYPTTGVQSFTSANMRTYYIERQNAVMTAISEIEAKKAEIATISLGNNIQVVPADVYDGETTNNYVVARIYKGALNSAKEWELDFSQLEYTVYIPIYLYLNTYGLSSLNGWDGNSVEINEDEKYILAPQVGAGKKNVEDNTFTGLVMGVEKTYDQDNGVEQRVGLLGYNHGKQSIWMDAESGKTVLGLPEDDAVNAGNPLTEGRIELVPGGTSRISRWRFDSRSLYRVISRNQTDYLENGLSSNRLYEDENYNNDDDFEILAKPYERVDSGMTSDTGKKIYSVAAPENAHGSIPHDQQGILLSAAPTYISVKGRPLRQTDGIDFNDANTDVSEGDAIEVELNPNTRSVFGIYNHMRTSDGTWFRILKAGIDESGRFFSNTLKSDETTVTIGYVGAFGQTAARHRYIGASWDFTSNGTLVKFFTTTGVNSSGKPLLTKTSPLYISSTSNLQGDFYATQEELEAAIAEKHITAEEYDDWVQKDPDTGWWIKDSNGDEGMRPIGMYSSEYFNIFTGDNDNAIEPTNNITALRLNHQNKTVLLGTSSNGGNTGKIDGSDLDGPEKAELKLTYGTEDIGHLIHTRAWKTYIGGTYNSIFKNTYNETVTGKVTKNYDASLINTIKGNVTLDWGTDTDQTFKLKFNDNRQSITFKDQDCFIFKQYDENRGTEKEDPRTALNIFEMDPTGLPKLHSSDAWSAEEFTGIRLAHRNGKNIKILQSSDSSRYESKYAQDNNVSEACGIILSSLSTGGIGLYTETPTDTKGKTYVNFRMEPSSTQPAFYLNASGSGSWAEHQIPGTTDTGYTPGTGSYVYSLYDQTLKAAVAKFPEGVTPKDNNSTNTYYVNGVKIGPNVFSDTVWITGRFGVEELAKQDWGSWADEAGLYVTYGIKAGWRIWSKAGIFAGQTSATDESAAYMLANGEIHAKITETKKDGETKKEGGVIYAERMQDSSYANPGEGSSGEANNGELGTTEIVKWAKKHVHPFKKNVTISVSEKDSGKPSSSISQADPGSSASVTVKVSPWLDGEEASYTEGVPEIKDTSNVTVKISGSAYYSHTITKEDEGKTCMMPNGVTVSGTAKIGNGVHLGDIGISIVGVTVPDSAIGWKTEPQFTPCTHVAHVTVGSAGSVDVQGISDPCKTIT